MYCKNCGKYIEYDAVYCDECTKNLEKNSQKDHYFDDDTKKQPTPEKPLQQGSVKDGLKKAIIGFVMATVASIIVAFAVAFITYFAEIYLADYFTMIIENSVSVYIAPELLASIEKMPYLSLIIAGISLPFSIVGIIFGAQSIKLFINAKKEGRKKPIPALILGIFATYESAISILSFLEVIGLFILMAII